MSELEEMYQTNGPVKLGLAMLPDNGTLKQIVSAQEKVIESCQLRPVLGLTTNLPHITILQGRFKPDANLLEVVNLLHEQLSNQKDKLALEIHSLKHFRSGYYFISLTDDSMLRQAHESACQHLLKHMYVLEEDVSSQDIIGLSALEAENQRHYGYSQLGESYRPHITFGRTQSRRALTDEREIQEAFKCLQGLKGNFERVTICAIGENGAHAKTLYQKELASGVPT